MTVTEAINLKVTLVPDPNREWVKPPRKHDGTEQILPYSLSRVQEQVNELEQYADSNDMKLKTIKTKSMLFNT
jgi:tetrahydromethanopterin S-methyltransferase subunit B